MTAAILACFVSCSRRPPVEVEMQPMPHPDKIYVTFPLHPDDGAPHYITDPLVLGRIESLVNAERGGWHDIVQYWGKVPIARAELTWYSGNVYSTLKVGDGWLLRHPMLQNIPRERAQAILQLLREKTSTDAAPSR
jgi:hypothetical protein